jgi:hypothetical protein
MLKTIGLCKPELFKFEFNGNKEINAFFLFSVKLSTTYHGQIVLQQLANRMFLSRKQIAVDNSSREFSKGRKADTEDKFCIIIFVNSNHGRRDHFAISDFVIKLA